MDNVSLKGNAFSFLVIYEIVICIKLMEYFNQALYIL